MALTSANTTQASCPTRSAGRTAHAEPAEPVVGLPLERADALLPPDLIQGGEIIILLLKPSPWYIFLGCIGHIVAIILVMVALGWLTPVSDREAALLGVALGGGRLIWQFLDWLGRIYVLTDRRVLRIMGVLQVRVFQARLPQIQHTDLLFSLRERLFRLGTLAFSTAGTAQPEAYWIMIASPLEVHHQVVQAINRYRGTGTGI